MQIHKALKLHFTSFYILKSLCDMLVLGMFTGRSGSGLCLTRNQTDQIGSPKPGLAEGSGSGGQMSSGFGWVLVGFRLCEWSPDFTKIIAGFCQNLWFLLDLTESQRDLGGSQRDQAGS